MMCLKEFRMYVAQVWCLATPARSTPAGRTQWRTAKAEASTVTSSARRDPLASSTPSAEHPSVCWYTTIRRDEWKRRRKRDCTFVLYMCVLVGYACTRFPYFLFTIWSQFRCRDTHHRDFCVKFSLVCKSSQIWSILNKDKSSKKNISLFRKVPYQSAP